MWGYTRPPICPFFLLQIISRFTKFQLEAAEYFVAFIHSSNNKNIFIYYVPGSVLIFVLEGFMI
jgi:hypothetical protein